MMDRTQRRQSLASATNQQFGGRTSQDMLRVMQSGKATPTMGGSPGSQGPSASPQQAGMMNAAAPGTFNGNAANGFPSAEVGFNKRGRGGGGSAPSAQTASTGTWSANPGETSYAATRGVWSQQGSGAAGTANERNVNLPTQPGTSGMTLGSDGTWYATEEQLAAHPWSQNTGGYQGAGGHGNFVGNPGYMSVQDYENPPQGTSVRAGYLPSMPQLNLGGGANPSAGVPGAPGTTYGDIQAIINAGGLPLQGGTGGMDRAPNAFGGPGAPGAGAMDLRNQMGMGSFGQAPAALTAPGGTAPTSTAGMTQIGDMGNGFTLHQDASGNQWIKNPNGTIEANGMVQAAGSQGAGKGGATGTASGGIPDQFSQYVVNGNLDENALKKSLGYGSKQWEIPDYETWQSPNIEAPYTANVSQFTVAGQPYYAGGDPGINRLISKYGKAAEMVQQMADSGSASGKEFNKATQEYNQLQQILGMYGINWNPLQGFGGDPGSGPTDPGGGPTDPGGGGGGNPGNNRGNAGGGGRFDPNPPFPEAPTSGPGVVDWTRDDFNVGNTDVLSDAPLLTRIDNTIQRLYGTKWENATPEQQAVMWETARDVVMEDEQLANKQKQINILQGGYESTLRDNNPFRQKSENLALEALNNYNPVDLQGMQNRLAGDYDKALQQSIEAASGSASRRGLSAGSQAGTAANLTGMNRQDLARALGEQEMQFSLADRQALYDAINAASGVNANYLGEELRQRQLLGNAVAGAYDPASSAYSGAGDAQANLKALQIAEKAAKGSGSGWGDVLKFGTAVAGAFL